MTNQPTDEGLFMTPCTRCGRPCKTLEAVALIVVNKASGRRWWFGHYHPKCADADAERGWASCAGQIEWAIPNFRLPDMPARVPKQMPNERPCT